MRLVGTGAALPAQITFMHHLVASPKRTSRCNTSQPLPCDAARARLRSTAGGVRGAAADTITELDAAAQSSWRSAVASRRPVRGALEAAA